MVTNEEYRELLNQCSQLMILEDSCTLTSIKRGNSISALSFIPFAALHCREAEEFLNEPFIDEKNKDRIYDLRNTLKFTRNSFNKIAKRLLSIDQQQDKAFKPNIIQKVLYDEKYYNLGIYLNENGDILFDTYSAILFMGLEDNYKQNQISKMAFKTGRAIGNSIGKICKYFNKKVILASEGVEQLKIGYQDINTHDNTVFDPANSLSFNLLVLHLLSIIGTDKYLLENYYTINTSWKYRQHISCAIAVRNGLDIIYKKINSNGEDNLQKSKLIKQYVDIGFILFPSAVRNSVMHYGLLDSNGCPLIAPEKFDPCTPFFGLIASSTCFVDIEYYFKKTYEYMNMIQLLLKSFVKIDINNTKWDL